MSDLVKKINKDLGEDFCNEFGRIRKNLAKLHKTPKKGIIFVYDSKSNRPWAINAGGGTEIQYHIFFDQDKLVIGYGLGFNTQYVPFANKKTSIEYMRPFMNSFIQNEQRILYILSDYEFVYKNGEHLKNPQKDDYILFGKTTKVDKQQNNYFIPDDIFFNIIQDLKKQLEAYEIIFNGKNKLQNMEKEINNAIDIIQHKKQIILQGPPGTGKTRHANDIAEQLIFGTITDSKEEQGKKLNQSEQYKLVQFHPSYTYEDFVRGIIVTTEEGVAEYKTVNKILGKFAQQANQSNLTGGVDDFERAWNKLVEDINEKKVIKIGTSDVEVEINSQGNIKFGSPVATFEKTYELYRVGKTDLKYETYQKIVLRYLKEQYDLKEFIVPEEQQSNKPYVLVIDEINRANLPSVLGELIYALEYRGKTVESLYSTLEEGNTFILPNNLYIIGTMNTADRGVSHIDYAIRRRFAFIEILPKSLQLDNFELETFKKVSELFIQNIEEYLINPNITLLPSKHLSTEFRPEDVWLGHSYFINNTGNFLIRIQYEIIPILKEYIKDGILNESAMEVIRTLKNDYFK